MIYLDSSVALAYLFAEDRRPPAAFRDGIKREKNPAAVALGQLGGQKGRAVRAAPPTSRVGADSDSDSDRFASWHDTAPVKTVTTTPRKNTTTHILLITAEYRHNGIRSRFRTDHPRLASVLPPRQAVQYSSGHLVLSFTNRGTVPPHA